MTRDTLAKFLDRYLTRPLFFAALLFLIVLAGASHRLKDPQVTTFEQNLVIGSFAVLWPVFLIEAVIRFFYYPAGSIWRRTGYSLLLICFPPLHLGSRGYARTSELWLPRLGWQAVDKKLRQRLERYFSVPLIIMALLTLPLLGMEYFWRERIESEPRLAFFLDLSTSVIWLAFAIEFILMVSVAERKVQYMLRHWVDLLIVALPLVDVIPTLLSDAVPMLRTLRASQALRLQQLTRLGRAYRMRALIMKLWRAVLVLEVIQRLTGSTPEKRLRRLNELLRAKEEEVVELREEIAQLEQQAAAQKKPAATEEVEPAA